MEGRIEEVAVTVAAVASAAGTALDAATILRRTLEALAPTLPVAGATLWLGDGADRELLASHPSEPREATPDDHLIRLMSADPSFGHLVIHPPAGATFDDGDIALLEIAAGQIAGALERARLFQEVMELERLKSDFIARVSHELRTPITIINGFLDTMLAHGDSIGADQRHHMLERSQVAGTRLAGLIEELLILSRLDAGVLMPDVAHADVAALLDGVRDNSTEPDQVLVQSPDGATFRTDRALLARALGLVVDNAIKYGGTAEVSAGWRAEDDRWVFEVRDRGAGFADDVRDTAFEMFTRSQGTTAVPGLGVGLSIARTLVEVLDGDIAVDHAHTGNGALVRITLPST